MDIGDVPAWFALLVSVATAINQWKVNTRAEQVRKEADLKAKTQRESDQQRQRIEQILRDLEDLSALALDYWMKPGSESGASGVLINGKVRDVSSRISRYGVFLWSGASQDFLLFKQAVTGGSFQSPARSAEKPTSTTVRCISSTSAVLKDRLRVELDKLDMPTRY